MNRTLVFGIAIFFAVVGIALVGGDSKAVAGHGCHGCHGCSGACDGGCGGYANDCCGCSGRRHGLFGHHRRRGGCCGVSDCAPVCAPSCACPAPACAPVVAPSCAGVGGPVMGAPVQGGVQPPPPPEGGAGAGAGQQPPPPPANGASARKVIRFPVVSYRA